LIEKMLLLDKKICNAKLKYDPVTNHNSKCKVEKYYKAPGTHSNESLGRD
jgi:hypothetical protein